MQNALDSFCTFADNLRMPNKEVRVSTLRILSHYAPLEQQLPTGDEPPNKKLKTEDSGSGKEDAEHTNVWSCCFCYYIGSSNFLIKSNICQMNRLSSSSFRLSHSLFQPPQIGVSQY